MSEPQFLYPASEGDGYGDSRPCFNKSGDQVVFMRQGPPPKEGFAPGSLWTVSATPSSKNQPARLFPDVPPTPQNQATRPDWSWMNGKIAFSGTQPEGNGGVNHGLFILESDGKDCQHIPIRASRSEIISYPSWYPDGQHVAVTNYNTYQILRVDSASQSGDFAELSSPWSILAGMSSVNQKMPDRVCMAAQLPGSSPRGYDQALNNIWVQPTGPVRPYCVQVEGHGIGRAPWWSPCGNFIAFESDYAADGYAIYVYRQSDQSLTPVTPLAGWFCQHPKWHPTIPNRLVISAKHIDGTSTRSGIAIVDFPESVVEHKKRSK